MTDRTCADVRAMTPELALGAVSGRDRADGLAHLAACPRCRGVVDDLAGAVDALLVIGPQAEPPVGFETAVIERLRSEAGAAEPVTRGAAFVRRWRRRSGPLLAAAAVAALLAVAALVVGVGSGGGPSRAVSGAEQVRTAAMSTADGRVVGRVVLTGQPDALFIALPTWRLVAEEGSGPGYRLRVTFAGGGTADVGPVVLDRPQASWGTVTTFDARSVRSVTLLDEGGRALCSATLRT